MCQNNFRTIQNKKHFFCISFITSIILMIIACIIAYIGFNFFSDLAYKFFNVDQDDYAKILLNASMVWKVLIIQFTLVPAIAMKFVEKKFLDSESVV